MRCKICALLLILFSLNASGQKPNILLIVSDDLNTRIGPYMNIDDHTPNLDRLAREGVKFTRAYAQYPVCGASRASFMSGLYPETNQGYFTARVSKIFHMGVPGGIERGDPGADVPESWDYAFNVMGPETLSEGTLELLSAKNNHYGSNFARMILRDEDQYTQTDYIATSQAIAILENRTNKIAEGAANLVKIKSDEPFFLAVGLVRPHVPLVAPENCYAHYPADEVQLPVVSGLEDVPEAALFQRNGNKWGMNEEQQKKAISAYMASVRFMDQQVGRLLDALDRSGARENTIVIFISDHGFNLGEHDCWSKVSLWEGSTRVPMIISAPGFEKTRGTTAGAVVELLDLYPTLTALAGWSDRQPSILQGQSLVPLLEDSQAEPVERYAYTVTRGGRAGALTGKRWKYTRWTLDQDNIVEELYDHENDPEELQNLAGDPGYSEILLEMRAAFDEKSASARRVLPDR